MTVIELEEYRPVARATVITDASFCPHTKSAGWAAWVTLNIPGRPVERVKQYGAFQQRPKSSTEAELWAAWNGIWLAYRHGARHILCQTDCLAVVRNPSSGRRGMSYSEIKATHWPEAVVQFRHVKGHTNRDEPRFFVNRWCDEQAGRVMRKQRKQNHRRRK